MAQLPVEDFLAYEAYAAQRMLPLQRIEFQLARIAMLIDAQRLPGESLSLNSYLINPMREAAAADPAPPPAATDDEAQAIATALGHKPRRRRPSDQPPTDAAPQS